MKTVAVVSDFHCGHVVGLTPPEWRHVDKRAKFADVRGQCWDFFAEESQKRGPFDVIIANGDLIDGKGARAEGVETIVPDRLEQAKMAVTCLGVMTGPGTAVYMSYGTDYHTGAGEDFEEQVASEVGGAIGSKIDLDIEHVVFEAKHHVGSSQVPHTRHTAIARDHLWSVLWAERFKRDRPNVVIRSHVHYFNFCGGPDWVAMTTPALQGLGARYGARRMSGLVDFGFIVFRVDDGRWEWDAVLAEIQAQRSRVVVL